MIRLTRLNHVPLVLNSDLIEQVEVTPDTVITMTPNRPHFRSILKSDASGLNGTDKRAPRQDFNWRMRNRKRAHK